MFHLKKFFANERTGRTRCVCLFGRKTGQNHRVRALYCEGQGFLSVCSIVTSTLSSYSMPNSYCPDLTLTVGSVTPGGLPIAVGNNQRFVIRW